MRVLVGIVSAAPLEARRAGVRDTWGGDSAIDKLFVVGGSRQQYVQDGLLHCVAPDDYESLPQKTRALCQWASANCDFDYLFKCDDDTYVHTERLVRWRLRAHYVGHDLGGFASGGAGYYLSRHAVEVIANELTAVVGPEDVLVGQLMSASGIRLEATERLYPWEDKWPQRQNDLITAHYCTPERMAAIHAELYGAR